MKKVKLRRYLSSFLLLCFLASSTSLFAFTPTGIDNTSAENLILKKESSDYLAAVFIEQASIEILTDGQVTTLFPFDTSKFNHRSTAFASEFIAKTQLLASQAGTTIIPSLDTSTLIYPFHSFL